MKTKTKTYDELNESAKFFVGYFYTKANFPNLESDPRAYLYETRGGQVTSRFSRPTPGAADLAAPSNLGDSAQHANPLT